jgi:hypothetical protein
LLEYTLRDGKALPVDECRTVANNFIEQHFRKHPVSSVDPADIELSESSALLLLRYALLIVHGRVRITKDDEDALSS